jgi:hypothetical protein
MAIDTEELAAGTTTNLSVRPKIPLPHRSPLWTRFFDECFKRRVKPPQLERAYVRLINEHPIDGRSLVYSLLDTQTYSPLSAEPLALVAIGLFFDSNAVDAGQVLYSLLLKSKYLDIQTQKFLEEKYDQQKNPTDLETRVFETIARRMVAGTTPRRTAEARSILLALSKWMIALANPESSLAAGLDEDGVRLCNSFGALIAIVLENRRMISIIDYACSLGML